LKIGIYGGTFDPVHIAHLVVAEFACEIIPLDQLCFMPSFTPPHKKEKEISSPQHRLNMLNVATRENDKFVVSDYEVQKGGTSFTVDTLLHFHDAFHVQKQELYLIIGADNLVDFHRWKAPDEILSLAHIIVAGRPNVDANNSYYKEFIQLHSPLLDISASLIRQRVHEKKSIRYLVPEAVESYIRENDLYT
jgi:nicotinate-nucleotide adenylyltransferase